MQKQARQLKVDANSFMFRDAVQCYWKPRLLEKMASYTNISSTQSTHPNSNIQPILSQPQAVGPNSSPEYYNCVELAQNAPSSTTSTSASLVSYLNEMHDGYSLDGLASSSNMSTIDYSSPSDCIGDGSNWVDGLLSIDHETWHGRWPHEWSTSMIL